MAAQLKPLAEQVMVITGASSGIGLATAVAASKHGMKLVVAARSLETLEDLVVVIHNNGGEAIAVECDVSDREQVKNVAYQATTRFGRIDTWVNNAGQGLYGRLDEVDDADHRRLFDINFWGVVYGSLTALPYLTAGGALINVGSEVSDAYAPLLGMYTASKHAVKGFTDTLRVEIEEVDQLPISITLIQPTAVNTPFPEHARNYQQYEPKLPEPMIDPDDVAQAILNAAATPVRHQLVGAKATLNSTLASWLPGMADGSAAKLADQQHYDEQPRNPVGTLHQSSEAIGVAGRTHGAGGVKPQA